MRPQAWHLIVLLVVVLLVFGASRLPDITRNVGKSLKIFKEEVKDLRDDGDPVRDTTDTTYPAGTTAPRPAESAEPAPAPQLPPTGVAPPNPAAATTQDAQPPSGR